MLRRNLLEENEIEVGCIAIKRLPKDLSDALNDSGDMRPFSFDDLIQRVDNGHPITKQSAYPYVTSFDLLEAA